jgi:hypothetical protein
VRPVPWAEVGGEHRAVEGNVAEGRGRWWWVRATRAGVALALGSLSLLALAGCGGSGHVVGVVVETQGGEPVDGAIVADPAVHRRATSDTEGNAQLRGLGVGIDRLTIAARGYYTTVVRVHGAQTHLVVRLSYRPPTGTYVFFDSGQIGKSNGYDWAQAVITARSVSTTEFDWTCNRSTRTDKLVGEWQRFPVALPDAIAPDVIAPGWVRRTVAVTHPAPPPHGCSEPLPRHRAVSAHFSYP